MRSYSTVSPNFWIAGTGKLLRGDTNAQVVALYLMTSPHASMIGVFHCPLVYIAHETGLSAEGASKGLQRLIEAGFCEYEEASETVFVLTMAAFQVGDSLKPGDKRRVGVQSEYDRMPESRMKSRFFEIYHTAFGLKNITIKTSPSEAPSKTHRSQEQEQEQEQEQDSKSAPPPAASPKGGSSATNNFPDASQAKSKKSVAAHPRSKPTKGQSSGWTPDSHPPAPLDAQVWAAWCAYRRGMRKPIKTQQSVDALAKTFAKLGLTPEQAAACVESSISNEYQGLFPDKFTNWSLPSAMEPAHAIRSGYSQKELDRQAVRDHIASGDTSWADDLIGQPIDRLGGMF